MLRPDPLLIDKIRKKIKCAVDESGTEGLLLSGGLDSSILAALAPGVSAFTVTLAPYGEDEEYAKIVTQVLHVKSYHRMISIEEAVDSIPIVIGILKSFDPAIPNDIATYFALKLAKEKGAKGVMTGDGADEEKISDEEFEEKRRAYPVRFISKEHLYYYEIYRKVIGEIPAPEDNQRSCSGCGAGIEKEANHCRICGAIQNE